MIISINGKNLVQHPFLVKITNKVSIKGMYLKRFTVNLLVIANLKAFLLSIRNKTRILIVLTRNYESQKHDL